MAEAGSGRSAALPWWEVLGNDAMVPGAEVPPEVLQHMLGEAVGREEGRGQC